MQGFGAEVLEATLLADQYRRQGIALSAAGVPTEPIFTHISFAEAVEKYSALLNKLEGTDSFIKLNPKQRKATELAMKEIAARYSHEGGDFETIRLRFIAWQEQQKQAATLGSQLRTDWDRAYNWLINFGFIEHDWNLGPPDPGARCLLSKPALHVAHLAARVVGAKGQKLTARGFACSAFADGHPLILGTTIADGGLEKLEFAEICAWCPFFPFRIRCWHARHWWIEV
jgi:hypothetical protein